MIEIKAECEIEGLPLKDAELDDEGVKRGDFDISGESDCFGDRVVVVEIVL